MSNLPSINNLSSIRTKRSFNKQLGSLRHVSRDRKASRFSRVAQVCRILSLSGIMLAMLSLLTIIAPVITELACKRVKPSFRMLLVVSLALRRVIVYFDFLPPSHLHFESFSEAHVHLSFTFGPGFSCRT
jgi:hypothetical protein